MRWLIKVILFPITLLLRILTSFLTFLLGIGTKILYLCMLFCVIGAIASFINKEMSLGIQALIIGFLVSPFGLPMVGATIVALIEVLNEKIKTI